MNKYIAFAVFAATVPAANWLIGNVGTECVPQGPCLIPMGFGFMAPSGVLMIGAALVLRDWLHELGGASLAVLAVMAGALASLWFSPPSLAIASAGAFIIAELCDMAAYAPLRRRYRALAVLASGLAGATVDSVAFTYLAFGSLDFAAGNVMGKIYASAAVAAVIAIRTRKAARAGNFPKHPQRGDLSAQAGVSGIPTPDRAGDGPVARYSEGAA